MERFFQSHYGYQQSKISFHYIYLYISQLGIYKILRYKAHRDHHTDVGLYLNNQIDLYNTSIDISDFLLRNS